MQLTQEHLNKALRDLATRKDLEVLATKLKGLATKKDFKKPVQELKNFSKEQTEDLARIVANAVVVPMNERFDALEEKLDVREKIKTFERKFQKLEEALHIKL